jgi:ferredoxin, 2Fe-2S
VSEGDPNSVSSLSGEEARVVRVEPSGVSIEVRPGESLMAAAERQGYRWPTVCHGQAACTVCCIVLENDAGAFEPPSLTEMQGLKLLAERSFYEGKTVRLACQARPITNTVVTKRGVRLAISST